MIEQKAPKKPTAKRRSKSSAPVTPPILWDDLCLAGSIPRDQIERRFNFANTVIPSASSTNRQGLNFIPGRERTAYFYRRMAMSFYASYRQRRDMPKYADTMLSCAKMYLKYYRERRTFVYAVSGRPNIFTMEVA